MVATVRSGNTGGYHHFQYFDQPSDPANLHNTNFGIVSVNDTEYTELLDAMRRTNTNSRKLHAAGAAAQQCQLDQQREMGGAFRGSIQHSSGLCLTADATKTRPTVGNCSGASSTWEQLTNGRLRHVESLKCLDLDRSVRESSELVLTAQNCSDDAPVDYEAPASWEHGADCLLMNSCRWLGTPVCGYGHTCLTLVLQAATNSVETTQCAAGSPSLTWSFIAEQTPAPTQPASSGQLEFQFRCRATPITPSEDKPGNSNLTFGFYSSASKVSAAPGDWSEVGSFTAEDAAHYPMPFPSCEYMYVDRSPCADVVHVLGHKLTSACCRVRPDQAASYERIRALHYTPHAS